MVILLDIKTNLMLLKFPEILPGYNRNTTLSFNKVPYAIFSVEKNFGNKSVFLTEHTLMFIRSGEKQIHLPDKTLRIEKNGIIFLKRGIYVMTEYFPTGSTFEAVLIFVPDRFLKQFIFESNVNDLQPIRQPYFLIPSTDLINGFIDQYKTYFGREFNNLQYILDIKLHELFLLLTASSTSSGIEDFINSLARDTPVDLDFIVRKNLFQPITIPQLAKLSGRSIASFKRDFEKQYSTSPRQWINHQRLTQAQLLLNTTSKNINEISFECGYENVSYFIKIFKKEFGKTPATFKRNPKS